MDDMGVVHGRQPENKIVLGHAHKGSSVLVGERLDLFGL